MKGLRRSFLFWVLLPFFVSEAFAAETSRVPETVYQAVFKNAENAAANGDKKETDFWIARYLGLAAADPASGRSSQEIQPLITKRKLAPKAFVSGEWDPDFIDWFERGLHARWGADDRKVRTKFRSFEIAEGRHENRYYAVITSSPEIELWHVLKDGVLSRPLLLLMGTASAKPTLFFGRILKGGPSQQFTPLLLDTKKRSLHYVWKPEFHDLDADGTPEVWVRFNTAWGNGFSQVLEIYRIRNDSELVFLKRFQSGDEGFARRLPDGSVELGSAFDAHKKHSRLSNAGHRVETWRWQDGAFKKASEKDIPLVLASGAWKDYFLEDQPGNTENAAATSLTNGP